MADHMNGIDQLRQWITDDFNDRCPDYEPTCMGCTVWRAFNELAKRCPDLSNDDASLAMHWVDRYAAGIDDYPQLDRIRPTSALSRTSTGG